MASAPASSSSSSSSSAPPSSSRRTRRPIALSSTTSNTSSALPFFAFSEDDDSRLFVIDLNTLTIMLIDPTGKTGPYVVAESMEDFIQRLEEAVKEEEKQNGATSTNNGIQWLPCIPLPFQCTDSDLSSIESHFSIHLPSAYKSLIKQYAGHIPHTSALSCQHAETHKWITAKVGPLYHLCEDVEPKLKHFHVKRVNQTFAEELKAAAEIGGGAGGTDQDGDEEVEEDGVEFGDEDDEELEDGDEEDEENEEDEAYMCDACEELIEGEGEHAERFHCEQCENLDLCNACYRAKKELKTHLHTHKMTRVGK